MHAPFFKFCYGKVESLENSVVEYTRSSLQVGLGGVCQVTAGVRPCQDSEVCNSNGFQVVKFLAEPLPVAALASRCKHACIPHVGSNVTVGLAFVQELCAVNCYMSTLVVVTLCRAALYDIRTAGQSQRNSHQ